MEVEAKKYYKFLAPRPVALVTTVDLEGNINAAPFSFITPISIDPPLIAISVGAKKDTLRNIRDTKSFVLNIMPEEMLDKLWICSQDFPPGVSEVKKAGLTPIPAAKNKAPLLTEGIIWFECVLEWEKNVGDHVLVVGRVTSVTVMDKVVGRDGMLDVSKAKLLMHIGGSKFTVAEREITVKTKNEEKS